jgi:hypothetical protein
MKNRYEKLNVAYPPASTVKDDCSNVEWCFFSTNLVHAVHDHVEDIYEHLDTVQVSEETS